MVPARAREISRRASPSTCWARSSISPRSSRTPEVSHALEGLEGDAAMAALVLRRMHVSGVWDTSEYVAAIPPSIRPFAEGRMSLPELETAESAKLSLIENGKKLRGLSLDRARAVTVEELDRADALGDVASVEALLREQDRRARERRGLR
jgi:HrpA-like RNA helicase